ncbi:MAG: preprotein translocase subunit YajC [Clostridiaceae bacterium]
MPNSQVLSFVIWIGAMFLMLYFIVFLPEKKRKKSYQSLIDSLKINDEVMTKGGIMGKIVTIKDDYIIIQTGPENVRIKLHKNGIGSVTKKTEEA